MLTRKTPETLAAEVTLKAQGQIVKLNVVYYNRTQEEIDALLDDASKHETAKTDAQYANRQAFLFIVKEWESEYALNDADVAAAELAWPGLIEMLFYAYHRARRVELTKN